jgi:dipeptidyl aminopeptidase/acylaminoacyl peptidase
VHLRRDHHNVEEGLDRLGHARSPARHVGRRSAPVLVGHGTADPVVPVDHARMIGDAYRRAGRPHQVELFDEPHDFRRAASIRAWLATELTFIQAHL